MKYLSTKLKLIILGVITTISIFTILGITKIFNDKEIKLISIKQKLLGIHKHVLEIENNIHHFSIRKQSKFVKFAFDKNNDLKKHIKDLEKMALSENLNINNLHKISLLQNQYNTLFTKLYQIEEEIGLSHDTGLRAKMRIEIHKVEAFFKHTGNLQMQKHILSIRRIEKDFLLRKNLLYVNEHEKKIKELTSIIKLTKNSKSDLTFSLPMLKNYQNSFMEIVSDYKIIGLSGTHGLFDKVETLNKLIDTQIEKTVKQLDFEIKENIINTIFIYIIISTTIIAIIILTNILIIKKVIKEISNTQKQLLQSEKMASLGSLVAGVAHEINTPIGIALTGISHLSDISKNIVKLYKADNLSKDEFEDYIKSIEDVSSSSLTSINKASELIRSFKKVSVDQTNEETRVFNLNEYTHELILSLSTIMKNRPISVHVVIPKKLNINSLPGAYGQIITNLIMNSLIHGYNKEDKGNIYINAFQYKKNITILYKDDGKGIDEKNLNKIFDPFFTTSRTSGGSGLGLHILYNIITTTFKGAVTCKSKKRDGVEFNITFPV